MSKATLTIESISQMTSKGRHELALWLRRIGDQVEKHPKKFDKKVKFRYEKVA